MIDANAEDYAEREALNAQHDRHEAMREVFVSLLAEIDAEVQVYTTSEFLASIDEPEYGYGCRDGCERCRSIVVRHAAAIGVDVGA